ncbi:catalase [Geomicrobium sp. JCM 19038]|uniref:catalase n=1 Tax=Geomicrobium sp. JCM 19038 TaxID=1460635 RepID=UPI00045F347A|nr:catalase [Geomicrobium sp. JCM 19038]GAK09080.1 catalase [Geomicrobium sp. JCM 19038]
MDEEKHTQRGFGTNADGAGDANDKRMAENETEETLTNRQGQPVKDNQNIRTVGNRGPSTLENYDFLEKMSHFDRERIPERVVHGRGAGAHGFFESYGKIGDEPISNYTRAKVFTNTEAKTPVFVRFSTVIHGTHSPETLRDPRGFAVKFYTEDGNWDLVGNNLKIFFIRDAIKFPDMVHAFKPDPLTNVQDMERFFDFIASSPESTHMITFLFSPWGIPANYRQMQGSGVNTYKWVNAEGKAVLVKYHWEPLQGIQNLSQKEADDIQSQNFNHATEDLYQAIEDGNHPEWELHVQIMEDGEHKELDFDPLDDTKLWYRDEFPWYKVGKMTLNKNPQNYFAEVEQAAFGTGVLVDGLDFSDDKMLQGRTFSYSDTQRYRVGANYLQLPINAPKKRVATNQRDGQMAYHVDTPPSHDPHINYEPSLLGSLKEADRTNRKFHEPEISGKLVREPIDRPNNFGQAGETWRRFNDWEREDLILNLSGALADAHESIQQTMIKHCTEADPEYGKRLEEGIKNHIASTKDKHDEGVEKSREMGQSSDPY